MYTRYCRSVLCTPAVAPERYVKCHRSGADICLVDLEDSVPAELKAEARVTAERFFSAPTAAQARCAVRINSVAEPDGLRDLLALRHYPTKSLIVQIPKVESPRDVEIVERVLGATFPTLELLAIVETPRGLENAAAIAGSSKQLRALIFGAADYASALGIRLHWETLAYARARLVNDARTADIDVIDSPTFNISDLACLRREASMAQHLGFSGKIALHPRQVPVINEVFSPDAEQLAAARRVVAAGQQSNYGIATVDGMMVGRPFFEASQRLLDEFG